MNRLEKTKLIRTGVVGLRHGVSHLRSLARREDFQIVAICDKAADPLDRVARNLELTQVQRFDDYDRMLAEGGLDAVVIATPVHLHEPMAVAALRRGIHVMLEKPMTHDVASALRLKDVADASKAVLQIGFEFRSSQLIRKVHQIIEAGELGEVVVVWTRMFRGPAVTSGNGWRAPYGMFFDCMIHELEGMMAFAGADFERLAAFGAPQGVKGPKPTDRPAETVTASVEFANAVRGSIAFSELSQTHDNTHFGIVGDRGRIDATMSGPEGAGSLKLYTHNGIYRTTIDIDGHKASRGHLGFNEQYDFFTATLRQGAPNVSDVNNGLKVQRFMAALEIAMCEGRTVYRHEMETPAQTVDHGLCPPCKSS